jgi:hypothetical protein
MLRLVSRIDLDNVSATDTIQIGAFVFRRLDRRLPLQCRMNSVRIEVILESAQLQLQIRRCPE